MVSPFKCMWLLYGEGGVQLTIDNSCHPPESQQDEKTYPIKGIFTEDESNVQHKGNDHHQTIKNLKLVVKELMAESKKLSSQLHKEKGNKCQAQIMEHL